MSSKSIEFIRDEIKKYCTSTTCEECALSSKFDVTRPCHAIIDEKNRPYVIENYYYLLWKGLIKEDITMDMEATERNEDKEMVKHPKHYNIEGRSECWDEMLDIFGVDAVAIFDILSAYKYRYRAGNKDDNPEEQDLAKIDNYMKHSADLIASSFDLPLNITKKCYLKMKEILKSDKK